MFVSTRTWNPIIKDDKKKLTTNAGAPVPDNQNVMTAGTRGPRLLQDVWFPEKLAHFDCGIPASYRHLHGFGSHTFSVINAKKERFWVTDHLRSQQGINNLTDQEAEANIGKCRESHQRDLYESIEKTRTTVPSPASCSA